MKEIIEAIAELVEEEEINEQDILNEFEEWDSLTILSIIAFFNEKYNITMSATEINNSKTVDGLLKLIKSKL